MERNGEVGEGGGGELGWIYAIYEHTHAHPLILRFTCLFVSSMWNNRHRHRTEFVHYMNERFSCSVRWVSETYARTRTRTYARKSAGSSIIYVSDQSSPHQFAEWFIGASCSAEFYLSLIWGHEAHVLAGGGRGGMQPQPMRTARNFKSTSISHACTQASP